MNFMRVLNRLSLIELGVLSKLKDGSLENFSLQSKFLPFFMYHDMVYTEKERWVRLIGFWQMILHCVE
jgi:hypothetical protein